MKAVLFMLGACAVLVGCQSPQLANIDRDYVGTYNATTGQGGVKVRWTPAAERGKGRPSVGVEIDFKQVVPAMEGMR